MRPVFDHYVTWYEWALGIELWFNYAHGAGLDLRLGPLHLWFALMRKLKKEV